jgi:hypothetical protein
MISLWKNNQNFTSTVLHVLIKKETEKAIQFEVIANPKLTFWLPKKAVKIEVDQENDYTKATIANWCTLDQWYWIAADRYANYFKR